jgi:phosphomannomutase/phosphoglucomutase
MTLGRLFAILGAVTALFWLAVGAGLYWAAADNARAERTATLKLAAETTARNLERVLTQAGGALEQLAQEPEFSQALAAGDPVRLVAAEERLTRLVPGALLTRLVPDTLEVPDENRVPKMGFADLEAVRQSRTARPLPAVHAANTPDAHIALVEHLGQGDGVILASLSPKLILSSLPAGLDLGAVELKQQALSLGAVGDAALRGEAPAGSVPIRGTAWTLSYWGPAWVDPGAPGFLGLPALGAVLSGMAVFLAYRFLAGFLRHDQDNINLLVRDLLSGKGARRYPLKLKDMQRLTVQLEALKHVVFEAPTAEPKMSRDTFDLDAPLDSLLDPIDSMESGQHSALEPPVPVPPAIFRAYDIRGVVGEQITPEVAKALGRAIGSEARDRGEYTVAVARDGRLSSADLSEALAQGLKSTGCSVIDLGLVPTPVLYFATHVLNTESGVMVTGSHNAPNYNGFKVVIAGEPLTEQDFQKLRNRIEENAFHRGEGQLEFRSLVPDYMERVIHDTQLSRDLKVVVDCGNGAAGNIAPALLEEIGCQVVPLFCDVDGNFPNHPPDPSNPKNLEALIAAVRDNGADLGIAFDGDGDRLGVVDSSGKVIWPDRQMMVFAVDVLSREPGSDVIFDVKCTRHLVSHVVRHGGRPLMWKTGHALIKAKIKETGALLAGDMSGHIFFKERWYGFDDGLYAAARLLEILSNDPRSSAEVFADLPDSVNTPELAIGVEEGEKLRIMERLLEIAHFPDARVTDIEGLRIDFADGWGLVRASHTKSALMLRFEGDDSEALARIMQEFRSLLKKAKPNIDFPLTLSSI